MVRSERELPTVLAEADALLRRGDVDRALRLVEELRQGRISRMPGDDRAALDRLRLRLRGALQYRLVEAPGLSPAAREEVRVALALGVLFGIGVSHLVDQVWPVLSEEAYSFLALDRYVARLRQPDAGPFDAWLTHIIEGLTGRDRERVRAELLLHNAYFTVLHSAELVEMERQLLTRPPQLAGVTVQALRRSGCPVCVWSDVRYTASNLPQLPALPAHPGCRCVYRPIPSNNPR